MAHGPFSLHDLLIYCLSDIHCLARTCTKKNKNIKAHLFNKISTCSTLTTSLKNDIKIQYLNTHLFGFATQLATDEIILVATLIATSQKL
jgi:hypothetical protein